MSESKENDHHRPEMDLPEKELEEVVPNSDKIRKEKAQKNSLRDELLSEQRRIERELVLEYHRRYGNLLERSDRKKSN